MYKYYLSSLESYILEKTRECIFIKKSTFSTGNEVMVVKISPPLIGQAYGMGGADIDTVVLAPRHKGFGFYPIKEFPCFVHVAIPINNSVIKEDSIEPSNLSVVGWGELYRTKSDADNHKFD